MKRVLTNWWVLTGIVVLVLLLVFCLGLPVFVAFFRPIWIGWRSAVAIVAVWLLSASCACARRARRARRSPRNWPRPTPPTRKARRWRRGWAKPWRRSGPHRATSAIISTAGRGTSSSARRAPARPPRCSIPGCAFPSPTSRSRGWAAPATSISGSPTRPRWSIRPGATPRRIPMRRSMRAAGTAFSACSRSTGRCSPINGVLVAIGVDELLQVRSRRARSPTPRWCAAGWRNCARRSKSRFRSTCC